METENVRRVLTRVKNENGNFDTILPITTVDEVLLNLSDGKTLQQWMEDVGQGTSIDDKTGVPVLPTDFTKPSMRLYTSTANDIGLNTKGVPGTDLCVSLYMKGNGLVVQHQAFYRNRSFVRYGIKDTWDTWYENLTDALHVAEIDYSTSVTSDMDTSPYVLSVNGYTPTNGNVNVPFDSLYVKNVSGKTLSSNDFTNEYKTKLDNINIGNYYTKEEVEAKIAEALASLSSGN